jgi:hypothetical protein
MSVQIQLAIYLCCVAENPYTYFVPLVKNVNSKDDGLPEDSSENKNGIISKSGSWSCLTFELRIKRIAAVIALKKLVLPDALGPKIEAVLRILFLSWIKRWSLCAWSRDASIDSMACSLNDLKFSTLNCNNILSHHTFDLQGAVRSTLKRSTRHVICYTLYAVRCTFLFVLCITYQRITFPTSLLPFTKELSLQEFLDFLRPIYLFQKYDRHFNLS